MTKNILIASTSTLYNETYLSYLKEEIKTLFKGIDKIIFIPFARPGGISEKEYTQSATLFFNEINIKVLGLNEFALPHEALKNAKGVFVGGGNTFMLVNSLYKNGLFSILKEKIEKGMPYLGTSAGSNICGPTMQTTNDMPIVYPPSFKTLNVIPFNINAHYLDPLPNHSHMGETRETRIKEFHTQNNIPVIGLREGSWISIKDNITRLEGNLSARVFIKNKTPYEIQSRTIIDL